MYGYETQIQRTTTCGIGSNIKSNATLAEGYEKAVIYGQN